MPRLTPEQYLEIERQAGIKSEFINGEMFAMSGGSIRHSRIPPNLVEALGPQARNKGCWLASSDLKVQASPAGPFFYPDLTVICGSPQVADSHEDAVLNPVVIFEVLSKSSEAYDRGLKFAWYRRILSLLDYVLVSQSEPRVEVFSRLPDGDWKLSEFVGLEAISIIPGVSARIPLADIYRDVIFEPEPTT
jgi:Uma2 family endonuclease